MLFRSLAVSCAKEEDLSPSPASRNYFLPDESSTDPESLLRREFFGKEDCYLLFNDTLRHEYVGNDMFGNAKYFTELVDPTYTLTGSSSDAYTFSYLENIESKIKGAEFIKNDLLKHLSKSLRPFSWLVVNEILNYTSSDGTYNYNFNSDYVLGNRCLTIALSPLRDLTDEEYDKKKTEILGLIVSDKLNKNYAEALDDFTSGVSSYYSNYMDSYPSDEDRKSVV